VAGPREYVGWCRVRLVSQVTSMRCVNSSTAAPGSDSGSAIAMTAAVPARQPEPVRYLDKDVPDEALGTSGHVEGAWRRWLVAAHQDHVWAAFVRPGKAAKKEKHHDAGYR
jgi:hypothetical protein